MTTEADDGLKPYALLMAWGGGDEGDYAYTGRYASSYEAKIAACEQMCWSDKTPEDDPELFKEDGTPLEGDELEEA